MRFLYKGQVLHYCELETGSQSCLPKLAPQAGRIRRLMRTFHKGTIVSGTNPRSRDYLRSLAAMAAEKKRHLRMSRWFVIHPLSVFAMYREIFMCLVWCTTILYDTFIVAFFTVTELNQDPFSSKVILCYIIQAILLVHILLSFIVGYVIPKTREIVLNPRLIALEYLSTYFLLDLLVTVPSMFVVTSSLTHPLYSEGLHGFVFLRFLRIFTLVKYLRQITWMLRIEDTVHEFVCIFVVTFCFIHWFACLVYYIPKVHFIMYSALPEKSWVRMANLIPGTGINPARLYSESLLAAISHFYAAGTGMYVTEDEAEYVLFSCIFIFGGIYCSYIIIMVFEIVSSTNASESKYEEIIHQLKEYMKAKNLPMSLRRRLILYYENRFHQHYFRETAILSTLSEHLRGEIFLHTCKHLTDKVKAFSGLSKTAVGNIVGYMKFEVFLPNDIIIRAGEAADYCYFIGHGTVALYQPNGREILHYEDGEHFGTLPILLKHLGNLRMISVIAADITECFRMEKKDLLHCFSLYPDFAQAMLEAAFVRVDLLRDHGLTTENVDKTHKNVLEELRKGRILDRIRRRPPILKK